MKRKLWYLFVFGTLVFAPYTWLIYFILCNHSLYTLIEYYILRYRESDIGSWERAMKVYMSGYDECIYDGSIFVWWKDSPLWYFKYVSVYRWYENDENDFIIILKRNDKKWNKWKRNIKNGKDGETG